MPLKEKRSRACDRCHIMKEKCTGGFGRESCDRCQELDRECTRKRPVQKAGRKPRQQIVLPPHRSVAYEKDSAATEVYPLGKDKDISSELVLQWQAASLAPFEEQLLQMLQSERPEQLNAFARLLVIGPNFEERLSDEIRAMAKWKFEGGLDGYLACMGALALNLGIMPGGDAESNIRRGALAVSKLRAAPGPTFEELENWVVFGLAIITFAMTALGTSATTVRRHVLKDVASLASIPEHLQNSDSLMCLVAFETWECLMKRSIPVLRLDMLRSTHVSRLFGIAGGLFSHLYDICEVSHALATDDEAEHDDLLAALTKIEDEVEMWQPSTPQDFVTKYTTIEVVHMLCQAEVYKISTLLFMHRLRYPFGVEDGVAQRLSRRITNDLERAYLVTHERVRCISFPFLVAGIEVEEKEEREGILGLIEHCVDPTTPIIQKQIKSLLSAIWQIRDVSTGYHWLDLLAHLPEATIPT